MNTISLHDAMLVICRIERDAWQHLVNQAAALGARLHVARTNGPLDQWARAQHAWERACRRYARRSRKLAQWIERYNAVLEDIEADKGNDHVR